MATLLCTILAWRRFSPGLLAMKESPKSQSSRPLPRSTEYATSPPSQSGFCRKSSSPLSQGAALKAMSSRFACGEICCDESWDVAKRIEMAKSPISLPRLPWTIMDRMESVGHDKVDERAQGHAGGAFGEPGLGVVIPGRAGNV